MSDSDLNGNLSKIKGISSRLHDLLPSTYIALGYDPRFKETLFTFNDTTLVYSELDQEFIGDYNYLADQNTIPSSGFFRVNKYEYINDELYIINSSTESPKFYLTLNKVNGGTVPLGDYSEITLLLHPNGNDIFSFDNLDIRTNVFNDFTESLPDSNGIVDDTVHQITYDNSYLTPTVITTNPGQSNALINRLVRAWRTQVPLTSNDNRYVDTYLLVTLRFNHTTDRKLVLHDVISYVRQAKNNI